MAICGRGHEIRGPQDKLADGITCRQCHRDNQARHAKKRKVGIALLRAAEARGLTPGEALALVQHADYWHIQDCQTRARA